MIVKVKKFLIYGIKDQVAIFFKAAQEKGFIEFISPSKKVKVLSDTIKEYISAIKILKKQPFLESKKDYVPAHAAVKQILQVNQSIEKLYEEKRYLHAEITRITPFGNYSKEELEETQNLSHRFFQFLCIKTSKREKIKLPDELIYVGTQFDLDYFVAINKQRKAYPKMIEIYIDRPLSLLKERLFVVERQIEKLQKELKEYAGYLKILKQYLLKELNTFNLKKAKNDASFHMEDSLFAIDAWVPVNKIDQLKILTKSLNVDFQEIAIEKKDRIPTYMDNKGFAKLGEDLVNIYDVPAVDDKDPSLWVLFSFAVFFAMIVSDAGYGLIYLFIAAFLKCKFKNPKPVLKRFMKLIWIISISCVIWGGLTGSFFGISPSPKDEINKAVFINYLAKKKAEYHIRQKDEVYQDYSQKFPKVKNIKDVDDFFLKAVTVDNNKMQYIALDDFKNNILMEFSILVGIIHIMLSFLRYLKRNLAGIGWSIFMVGGYLYFPKILNAVSMINFLDILSKQTSYLIGLQLVIAGIALAVILAIIQKKYQGFIEITNVVQVFADVLSYLRLYALGLAGMIMASTFNGLGVAMGLFFGFLIVIAGHAVNIVLTIMGGVIHGLRLNFIEWYHHSFKGDGKLFDPLKLLK